MQTMQLKGRWVLVTGASSGLGAEVATQLAREHGAHLVLVARREDRLLQLKETLQDSTGVQVEVIAADLAVPEDVDRVLESAQAGPNLYAAVLNAGITHFGDWDELDWAGFERMQAVNNTSVVRMTMSLLKSFEQAGQEGGLLLVASMAGLTPVPYQAFYSATKAFLVNLGASLHHEMLPRGVSVSTFVPGGIDTEMTAGRRFASLRGWLMPVNQCAAEAIYALTHRKYVHAPGVLYKVGGVLTRLLPQRLVVGQVAGQYRRSLNQARAEGQ